MADLVVSELSIFPSGHADNAEACAAFYEGLDVPTVAIPENPRDYLDWLGHDHLPAAVCKGRDVHGRRFIALRVVCFYRDDEPEKLVLVAHERYAQRLDLWVVAGGDSRTDRPLGHPSPDIEGLTRLINREIAGEDSGIPYTLRLV